jgi:hypothetical protein
VTIDLRKERSEMMLYGESDYWVARYRSLTEHSVKQTHAVEDCRQQSCGTALVTVLFGRIARRSGKKKASLDGRA